MTPALFVPVWAYDLVKGGILITSNVRFDVDRDGNVSIPRDLWDRDDARVCIRIDGVGGLSRKRKGTSICFCLGRETRLSSSLSTQSFPASLCASWLGITTIGKNKKPPGKGVECGAFVFRRASLPLAPNDFRRVPRLPAYVFGWLIDCAEHVLFTKGVNTQPR